MRSLRGIAREKSGEHFDRYGNPLTGPDWQKKLQKLQESNKLTRGNAALDNTLFGELYCGLGIQIPAISPLRA